MKEMIFKSGISHLFNLRYHHHVMTKPNRLERSLNNLNDVLPLFHIMFQTPSRLSIFRGYNVSTLIANTKYYSTVISLSNWIGMLVLLRDCRLNRVDLGAVVLSVGCPMQKREDYERFL